MAATDPCSLLTNSEAATLGLLPGKPEMFGKQRRCEFRDTSTAQEVSGSVSLDSVFGIDSLRAPSDIDQTGIRKLTVDGRRVNYYPGNGGTICAVNIEINKTEVALVTVTLRQGNKPEPPCAIAEKAVGFVLPRMPKK